MKNINQNLFRELRRINGNITMGWKIVRKGDGYTVGFTTYDQEFIFDGLTYSPNNAFSGTAATSRSTLSVDNMTAMVLFSDVFKETELKGGVWDGANCEVFWICPGHPEWGIAPLRGGTLGEFKFSQLRWEVDLRSILQRLQQATGGTYNLDCTNILGDKNCRVVMNAPIWTPNTKYTVMYDGEAQIGSIVRPSVANGFWYVCTGSGSTEGYFTGYTSQYGDLNTISYNAADGFGTSVGSFTPGAKEYMSTSLTTTYGNSGGSEPAWPFGLGAEILEGAVAWKAIYARRHVGTITSTNAGDRITMKTNVGRPDHFFQYGTFKWLTGNNTLLQAEVRDSLSDGTILLLDIVTDLVQVGDTFEIAQGCSKNRSICKGKPWDAPYGFNNIRNMFAFPDMPTEDKSLASSQPPKAIAMNPQPEEDDDS